MSHTRLTLAPSGINHWFDMTQVPKTSILLSASMSSHKQKYIYTFPGANRGLQGMFFFQDYNQILPGKKTRAVSIFPQMQLQRLKIFTKFASWKI